MKKFTFILVGILVTTLVFAQNKYANKAPKELSFSNSQKSEWVGNTGFSGYSSTEAGYEYAIRFTAGELTAGEQITSIQFYSDVENLLEENYNGGSYQIKIYEGGSFDETNGYDVITACGTAVYTQDYTATTSGSQEVELTTAYTIGADEFWIAIHCNGVSVLGLGTEDATSLNSYVNSFDYNGTDYWSNNEFCTNSDCSETAIYPFTLAVYVDDGGAYIENSDLSAFYIDNETDQNIITTLTLDETDDLDVLPVIYNAGPDNADQIISIEFTVNGTSLGSVDFDPTTETTEGYLGVPGGVMYPATLMTAAEMDTDGLTEFDVCITLTYAGVDNVASNNIACLTVTRGEATVTECDLEPVFMTSNTDPTPIASTLNITTTDNITVFPAVTNNGPDDANTTATVSISIEGTDLLSESIDMTGLTNGSIDPLTTAGQEITAEEMNSLGLTGTFDVCMTVTYDGTDNVTDNNETCVTVTRDPVNVNTNLASSISVFPNPANNVITVANAENANITIINMVGAVVSTVNNASANQTIDISELANGTYFVRIDSEVFKINVVK